MVKLVQCVTRKQGMEAIDFRQHWMEYGKLLDTLVRERPNVVRFRLTTTLLVKESVLFMLKYGSAAPFDGMVEIWLDDATITSANLRFDPQSQSKLEEIGAALREFVDNEKSTTFFALEEMTYDRELDFEKSA